MVKMMSQHRAPCTGPTDGAFLRPGQRWLLSRCSLHAPAVTEAVIRNHGAAEKVATGPTLSMVRRE